jgi:hypothetical protein
MPMPEAQAYLTIALFVAQILMAIILALVGFIVRGATRAIERLQATVENLERALLKDYLPRAEFQEHAEHVRGRIHDILNLVHGIKVQVQILAAKAGIALPSAED